MNQQQTQQGEPKSVVVARYLLQLAAQEPESEPLTHMRLQKLLYYVQGWSLVATDRRIFDDPIEAWVHGPVVARTYRFFADYQNDAIEGREARDDGTLSDDEKALIASVWNHYKQFSATALRTMTHREPPWCEARTGLDPDEPSRAVLTLDQIKKYFRSEYGTRTADWEGLSLDDFAQAERDVQCQNVRKLSA